MCILNNNCNSTPEGFRMHFVIHLHNSLHQETRIIVSYLKVIGTRVQKYRKLAPDHVVE